MGKNVASPQHYIELYLHERLLHTIGFNAYPLLSSKTPPPAHHHHHHPSFTSSPPPVFTVESHTEQIGTEQSSEAEETWSHCGGNWTLLSLSAPSHPSFSLHIPNLHLSLHVTFAPLPSHTFEHLL